jgi:signal peptidase II
MKRKLIAPITAAICMLLDQSAKTWARSSLIAGSTQQFIPGFLKFTLTTNTGGAFSVGRGNNTLMTVFVIIFVMAIVYWMVNRERSDMPPGVAERIGMGALLGGALGNLWDRLTLGHVTDFLDFAFISFPVFNLADVCIDIGLAIILIRSYFRSNVADTEHGKAH